MPEQFENRYTSNEHLESSSLQVLSNEAVRPLPGVLMTHTSQILDSLPISDSNRTPLTEPPRIFPSTVPINLNEIRPIIAQACSDSMSLTSWLNVRLPGGRQSETIQVPQTAPSQSADFFVINVENEQSPVVSSYQNLSYAPSEHQNHHHHITTADNFLNNIREASSNAVNNSSSSNNNNNNNNSNNNNNDNSHNNSNANSNNHHHQRVNNNDDNNTDGQTVNTLPVSPEAREVFKTIQNHLPFVGLLITKGIYDHRSGTLCLFLLLIVFIKANNDLKREIAKQQSRSRKTLFHILCYIFGALAIIGLVLDDYPFFFYTKTLSFWNLLWNITVTDFVIKLITVALKTLLTCLPANFLAFQKRGKYYLWMEATSQFYRSTVPMYSWMSYFKEAYQGPEVILGIIMASLYGATKVRDLLYRGKFFIDAFIKFWQNVNLGSYPSKEQLVASGGICVICHEEYSSPVQLHCNHIFCEACVSTWFDRERTCPLCRAPITDDPIYRDGHTTHFLQFY